MTSKTRKPTSYPGVRQIKSTGRWEAQLSGGPGGKRRFPTFDTFEQAMTAKVLHDSAKSNRPVQGATYDLTLAQVADAYLAGPGATKQSFDGDTLRLRVHVLPTLGNTLVRDLRAMHVIRLHDVLVGGGMAETTRARVLQTYRQVLTYAVQRDILDTVPWPAPKTWAERPKAATGESTRHSLNEAQVDALVQALPTDRDRALVLLLVDTGMRLGNAAGLNVGHLDLDDPRGPGANLVQQRDPYGKLVYDRRTGKLRPTKKGTVGWVPLTPRVVQALRPLVAGRAPGEPLFVGPTGKPLAMKNWRVRVLYPAADQLALDGVTPHWFRHTMVTQAFERGVAPTAVQAIADHADLRTTMGYSHLDKKALARQAVAGYGTI